MVILPCRRFIYLYFFLKNQQTNKQKPNQEKALKPNKKYFQIFLKGGKKRYLVMGPTRAGSC